MELSVVIPAFNEAANVGPTLRELRQALASLPAPPERCQVLVVDDHSTDGTFEAVADLGDPDVACLRLSRRSGSHVALRAGLAAATGQATLCISADGQDGPETLGAMLDHWQRGAQIVWGLRRSRAGEPWHVRLFSRAFYRLLRWIAGDHGADIDLDRADFFLLDRVVVEQLGRCPERNTSLFGLIAWSGFRQQAVQYDRRERRAGRSKWSFGARLRLATDWILAFSAMPLRIIAWFGGVLALLGIAWLGVTLSCGAASSLSAVGATVLLVGGAQLGALGVIGEYLWRTLDEARRRPLYFIERSTLRAEARPP
jgi:dolichol-phosphate mannosyltransferase